jgi:hypothetical protein
MIRIELKFLSDGAVFCQFFARRVRLEIAIAASARWRAEARRFKLYRLD